MAFRIWSGPREPQVLSPTPSHQIADRSIHPPPEHFASFFIYGKKTDKPDQSVRIDEPFPKQYPDELPVLVPPGSELTHSQVVGLEAVAGPIKGVGVPNRPGSTFPSPG